MNNHYNPFKENRTEQMRDLWKYYVPFPGLEEDAKPIIVQGGRGSGKTMFFQCNSWREKLVQIKKLGNSSFEMFTNVSFIGLYYRVDTTFVSSMKDREEENWGAIFETYLAICIFQEILDFIIRMSEDMQIEEHLLSDFARKYSAKFSPDRIVDSISSLRNETEIYLDVIEDRINGLSYSSQSAFRYVTTQRFIQEVCQSCNILFSKNVLYKVFIDEYETLQEYQQRIVNTLIKHSTPPVIFNIGLRPQGMKSNLTVSETETIESPHDYERVPLGIDTDSYPEILRKICAKRIALGKEQGRIPNTASENIDDYLGEYSLDYELSLIESSGNSFTHIQKLKTLIEQRGAEEGYDAPRIQEYIASLCMNAPKLNSRLHYALLCTKTAYTPHVSELYEAYISKNARYLDWLHNRKFALVFLLCKESKRGKMYYGTDVFTALSSNIVRYFLELCEQTFRIAFLYDYNWDGKIAPSIQTEAACYVSEYKVMDISGDEPYGRELRIFTQYLGQIFYKLHTDESSTLGEPEPNHFSTKDLSLDPKTKALLSSSILWNVLQEGEPTKRKQSKLSPETVDYSLNKIYVPYFGISYRIQRKIQLNIDILEKLLSGSEEKAKEGFRQYFRIKNDEPILDDNPARQISIFELGPGGKIC